MNYEVIGIQMTYQMGLFDLYKVGLGTTFYNLFL